MKYDYYSARVHLVHELRSRRPQRIVRAVSFAVVLASALLSTKSVHAFRVVDGRVLDLGILRWDAAPHFVDGQERSLDGGLRYSVQGGSYEAYRDLFPWIGTRPSVPEFQTAVEQAFSSWEAIDPASGLGTDLRFVPDLDTSVFAEPIPPDLEGRVRLNRGAEIDLLAEALVGSIGLAVDFGDPNANTVTLTSGVSDYTAAVFSGADIYMNTKHAFTMEQFQRVLSHEIGHAIGLGDVDFFQDDNAAVSRFYDDNYDNTSSATALATLTNSFAHLIDPLDPDNSPALMLYDVCEPTIPGDITSCAGDPGIDSPGVEIHMESSPTSRPVSGPQNDDFAGRQFFIRLFDPSLSRRVLRCY